MATSKDQHMQIWIIPVAAATVLIAILAAAVIFYWYYSRKMYYLYRHLNRLSATQIEKVEKLGEGNFGEVWKAKLKKDTIVVKMLKESATDREEKEFREEALLLSKFNNDHIVKAVGICLQSRPIMLGLEFVNGGSLDSYLRRDQVRTKLNSGDLFHIAEDALKGCIYLEQEGYIHRDIASGNCLVETMSETNLKPKSVKLSDFGLTKDIGVESAYRSRNPNEDTLPIAWTAPEAFAGKFSPKSDVWAFGVLLWEIFTWAATPYGRCSDTSDWHICPANTLSHDEVEFKVCAERKNLLSFPDPCTAVFCAAVKNVLCVCWNFAPNERPSFKQLQKYLNGAKTEILNMDVHVYFTHVGRSSVTDRDDVAQADRSRGTTCNLVHEAYRDTTEKVEEGRNPFVKTENLPDDVTSQETIELLPVASVSRMNK